MVEPNQKFENETGLCVTSAIVKLDKDNKVKLGVINVLPHKVTIQKNTSIARITILTAKQADYLQPVDPALLANYFEDNITSLISDSETPNYTSPDRHWFPTPENCAHPEKLEGIHKESMMKLSS